MSKKERMGIIKVGFIILKAIGLQSLKILISNVIKMIHSLNLNDL